MIITVMVYGYPNSHKRLHPANEIPLVRDPRHVRPIPPYANPIPPELRVVNDYGNHYLWEPSYAMRLEDYAKTLASIGELFYKLN
jgi:hypothetical protein